MQLSYKKDEIIQNKIMYQLRQVNCFRFDPDYRFGNSRRQEVHPYRLLGMMLPNI